ncbi:MAG: DUF4157 domain-containing protein [Chitinophagaceae bacterium]|nr:DUF4157 domain-containing protein [Chitinophagaceae bacterium]
MKVRIKENSWQARMAAFVLGEKQVAIVFGKVIHLHNTTREEFLSCPRWVCHEMMHVWQYKRYGFIGFILRYLFSWMCKSYYNNRFEKEARNNEENLSLMQNVEFV